MGLGIKERGRPALGQDSQPVEGRRIGSWSDCDIVTMILVHTVVEQGQKRIISREIRGGGKGQNMIDRGITSDDRQNNQEEQQKKQTKIGQRNAMGRGRVRVKVSHGDER
jgi:hypothetical protein